MLASPGGIVLRAHTIYEGDVEVLVALRRMHARVDVARRVDRHLDSDRVGYEHKGVNVGAVDAGYDVSPAWLEARGLGEATGERAGHKLGRAAEDGHEGLHGLLRDLAARPH